MEGAEPGDAEVITVCKALFLWVPGRCVNKPAALPIPWPQAHSYTQCRVLNKEEQLKVLYTILLLFKKKTSSFILCMYMCVHVCGYIYICRGQRSISGIFLNRSPPYLLRSGSFFSLMLTQHDFYWLSHSTSLHFPYLQRSTITTNSAPQHVSSDLGACPFCHSSLRHFLSCHGALSIVALGAVSNTIYIFTFNEARMDSPLDHWGVVRHILWCYHHEINWEFTSELSSSLCDA